jgi:uncharacterized protein (DUF488 family)
MELEEGKQSAAGGKPLSIWTIGHSTRPIDDFIELLTLFGINFLVDVRRYPGSKRYPQYNREALRETLLEYQITYTHLLELGGRRTPASDSHNTAWRHVAFRGYADYMETNEFLSAIGLLENIGSENRTAFMCSEAPWWRCHRSLISDYLKASGWEVLHIMGKAKAEEHPYTGPAVVIDGKLTYR